MDWLLNSGARGLVCAPDFFGFCTSEDAKDNGSRQLLASSTRDADPDGMPVLSSRAVASSNNFPFGSPGKQSRVGLFTTQVPDLALPQAGTGIRFAPTSDGSYVVRGFVAGSSAEECAAITVGDTLLEVEGRPVGGVMLKDLAAMLLGDEGTFVRLRLRRDHGVTDFGGERGVMGGLCEPPRMSEFAEFETTIERRTLATFSPGISSQMASFNGAPSPLYEQAPGTGLLVRPDLKRASTIPHPSPMRVKFGSQHSVNVASVTVPVMVSFPDAAVDGNTKALEAYIKHIKTLGVLFQGGVDGGGQTAKVTVSTRAIGARVEVTVRFEVLHGHDAATLRDSMFDSMTVLAEKFCVRLGVAKRT